MANAEGRHPVGTGAPAPDPPPPPADAAERARALEPHGSFIVQAPAGSGKTALLVQRLLVLLATVERPEQVLAITFTRKAAAEMRARLLDALAGADAEASGVATDGAAAEPGEPGAASPQTRAHTAGSHEAAALERARAVLARDRSLGWRLLESPARLRIQTIDSLCAALAREGPLRSGLGEGLRITEAADLLYREAARATLAELEGDGAIAGTISAAVERLLLHLDGNHARVEALLCAMLAKRDQWLRRLLPAGAPEGAGRADRYDETAALRTALEAELRAAVQEALQALRDDLRAQAGPDGSAALAAAIAHAMAHLEAVAPDAPLRALTGLDDWPAADPAHPAQPDTQSQWRGLAELLITAGGTWRKTLTKAQGFPTDKAAGDPVALKAAKAAAQGLLDALSGDAALAGRLREGAALPPPAYSDAQWAVLESLLTLLPRAVEHLRGVFARAGENDYAEVALAALRAIEGGRPAAASAAPGATGALGWAGPGGASAAASADDETRHILVDEFQDTSHGQYRLLERLTAHWPLDGSHTLFLVGDPMQSIYRFREADVGLFLRARSEGLGALRLTPLRLRVNFRSTSGLLAWTNSVFPQVMPSREDAATGAVPFAEAAAHHGVGERPEVTVHALLSGSDSEPGAGTGSGSEPGAGPGSARALRVAGEAEEARAIAELIARCRSERPEETVAVLARARSHVRALVPALQAAGLPFQAVELEPLGQRPEVQDVLMLARALTHLGDRVAWLAVLRAPLCGLTLADLLHLAGPAPAATLWSRLTDPAVVAGLTAEGRERVARVAATLAESLAGRDRRPLRRWVEAAWLALGGPACTPQAAWPNVDACLARLEALPSDRPPGDPEAFAALVERLFAGPDSRADERLQVMSIHRAKGLQFDTVIVPGLERGTRGDDAPLLRWFERALPAPGGAGLLLAPIHETGPERDPAYGFLASLDRERAQHETGRLVYVAVTRARRSLHLFGRAKLKDGAPQPPPAQSLLGRLWPAVEGEFLRAAAETPGAAEGPGGPPLDAPASAPPSDGPSAPPAPVAGGGLRRLVRDWQPPAAPPAVAPRGAAEAAEEAEPSAAIEFSWAGETARCVGTVVHRLLRLVARHGTENWVRWEGGQGAFRPQAIGAALGALGVATPERETATGRVLEALRRTLADERGRWVLAPYPEGRSEYALTGWQGERAAHYVIDRTFIDAEGVRWIVDFKTGGHEGSDTETFLNQEQERYRAQLEGYAGLLRHLEPGRPIRLALYFPLLQAWREWAAPEATAGNTS